MHRKNVSAHEVQHSLKVSKGSPPWVTDVSSTILLDLKYVNGYSIYHIYKLFFMLIGLDIRFIYLSSDLQKIEDLPR